MVEVAFPKGPDQLELHGVYEPPPWEAQNRNIAGRIVQELRIVADLPTNGIHVCRSN
jgi:hypothetical protein